MWCHKFNITNMQEIKPIANMQTIHILISKASSWNSCQSLQSFWRTGLVTWLCLFRIHFREHIDKWVHGGWISIVLDLGVLRIFRPADGRWVSVSRMNNRWYSGAFLRVDSKCYRTLTFQACFLYWVCAHAVKDNLLRVICGGQSLGRKRHSCAESMLRLSAQLCLIASFCSDETWIESKDALFQE